MKFILITLLVLFPLYSHADNTPYPIPKSTHEITYYPETFKTSDGIILHGHLAVPAGIQPLENGFPTVIILAGSGRINRYENIPKTLTANNQPTLFFQAIEKSLVNRGIAVFAYDKRGVVPLDNSFLNNKITNDYKTADANHLANDALQAFDYVTHLKQVNGAKLVDSTKISVLGHSEGTILALHLAEQRPSIKSLLLLGMITRSMKDTIQFQFVTKKLRDFNLYNTNQDGVLTKKEYNNFATQAILYDKKYPQQASSNFLKINPTWDIYYKIYSQLNTPNKISIQEFNFVNEQAFKSLIELIHDSSQPWMLNEPRDWFAQYFQEAPFLKRELIFCKKMHVFQGQVDPQSLFEDALEIRSACQGHKTPLASFNSYPGLTHGFSHYTGYKKWRYTMGPIDPQVVSDVTLEAVKDLK